MLLLQVTYLMVMYFGYRCSAMLSHVPLFVAPWKVARQAPLSLEFPRQEYWSRLSFPPPGCHLFQIFPT